VFVVVALESREEIAMRGSRDVRSIGDTLCLQEPCFEQMPQAVDDAAQPQTRRLREHFRRLGSVRPVYAQEQVELLVRVHV
jgi:hypothetical protein